MFRRYFFPVLACAVLMASTGLFVSAQTGMLRGHVKLKQPDGTKVPLAGAVIDVYRVDVTGKYNTKTDKKGEYVFAGLPYVGTYVVAVSQPTVRPDWLPNVKAGREVDYDLEVTPGDGRRLTYEEIKTQMAGSRGPATGEIKESAADKAKREEIEKKNAAVLEKNKNVEASNALIERTFKAGNAAIQAKNFDEAIAQFNEGLSADPEHPGIPSLLTNKAVALNGRAVARYNAAIQSKDDAAKTAGIEAAKKDWTEANAASTKAVEMLKAAPPSTDPAAANNNKLTLYFALIVRAETARFVATKVDQNQVDAGVKAYEELIAAETDPLKKATTEHGLAQMLFDANAFDKALVRYQKILEVNPDDLDALLRAGQALFNIGAINSDKDKYQLAADYLARFVAKAPDTNAFKEDAKAILETLKAQENVKPAGSPARRRRP
jgi:tetratricopeptide (TPR) repeat protein